MNNDYELNRHKKSDTVKWIVAFALIAVLLVGMAASLILAVNNGKDKEDDVPVQEEEQIAVDGDGNEMESGKTYAMPANMIFASAAAEQTDGITLQATITPETAENKTVDWGVSFVNPTSAWASGKTASDYVTVTPTSDGALTATVNCLKAFGEQIKITVTSRANENAKADCILDYARRIVDTALYHEKLDTNVLEFGSDEVLIDMVVPDFAGFKSGMSDGTLWAGEYYQLFIGEHQITPEDEKDPLATWADKFVNQTYRFSDYTIKDCMPVVPVGGSEYELNIKSETNVPQELINIFIDFAAKTNDDRIFSFQEISRNGVLFGNNPIMIAVEMLTGYQGIGMSDFTEELYEKFTKEFIDWVKAHPDEPFFEYTMTFTGKYSTFTRNYSFRFNPETAVMPVFDVTLDQTAIVL